MPTTANNNQLKDLYKEARACKNKRRMYVYEQFKSRLYSMDLSPMEYEQACRQLARILEV